MNSSTHARDGYSTVTAYIMVPDAERVLEFVQSLFGAAIIRADRRPDGSLGHTEVRIGDSMIMLAGTGDEWPAMPAALHVYVADVDDVWQRALALGVTPIREPEDQPYGDRMAGFSDAAGNQWWIASAVR